MKQNRKLSNRVLSLLLALVLMFSMIPMTSMTVSAAVAAWNDTKISVIITDLVYTNYDLNKTWNLGSMWSFATYSFEKVSDGKYKFTYKAAFAVGDFDTEYTGTMWTDEKSVEFDGVTCDSDYSKTIAQEYTTPTGSDKWTYNLLITRSGTYGHQYGAWSDNGDGTHSRVCRINSSHVDTVSHSWSDATCSSPQTCTQCGATQGSPATDAHTWNDATCVLPKTCKYCEKTEGDVLGHDIVATTFGKPTACSRCGATDLNTTVLEYALINTNISLPTKDIKSDNTGYYDITWTVTGNLQVLPQTLQTAGIRLQIRNTPQVHQMHTVG